MRAVIYARYSSSSQREESIEGQVKECTAYAERNGYHSIVHRKQPWLTMDDLEEILSTNT